MHIVAGDIGGTKSSFGLFALASNGVTEVRSQTFTSRRHQRFEDLLKEFLGADGVPRVASFAIAGPVMHQRCVTTNLPWVIDAEEIRAELGLKDVWLLNDIEAAAHAMAHLSTSDFVELNPEAQPVQGHQAVISVGTGLGQAILFFDGERHQVLATEGGHASFAPQNDREDQLLRYLRESLGGHVSMERILAGNGFATLYDWLKSTGYARASACIERAFEHADRNAVVSTHGMSGDDALCVESVRMFCRILGAEAGNLALKCLPRGGLYVAGGVAPKIRPALASGDFLDAYLDKGRLRSAIDSIPIRLVLNPAAPLLGAAHDAARRVLRL
jgi:glucokinase